MGRLIDIDVLFDYFGNDVIDETTRSNIEYFVSEKGTVEAIPKTDYEARLKADIVAILTELQLEIEELEEEADIGKVVMIGAMDRLIQQKIDLLQKQTTNNCDNCFNGTTKGGCAVKELMKNKDCKYYMPRKNNALRGDNE